MEPRSKRRRRRSPPPPPPQHGDRISALPDDMLIQVLLRLRCAQAASRTGLISRRWRGLWTRLPGLTFRYLSAAKIKSALAHVPRRTAVSRLEIGLCNSKEYKLDDARAKSLLLSAARLSPEEMVFVLPKYPLHYKPRRAVTMVLPCFQRATSIELDTCFLRIKPPPTGELPMVKTLSISGNIVDLGALLKSFPRLRVFGITFRGVEPLSLEAELAILEAAGVLGLTVSRLGIEHKNGVDGPRFASLLRAAARISPQELLFTSRRFVKHFDTYLPCFHRTTAIEMNLYDTHFTQLPDGEFSALERLALSGCTITDLDSMFIRCPRLRMLKVRADKSTRDVKIHWVSLEELELYVNTNMECQIIHMVTPLLKQLKVKVHGKPDLDVSISAPMLEKFSWSHTYASSLHIFGFWWLNRLKFETIESYKQQDEVFINDEEGLCPHLPRAHVLSMDISSYNNLGVVMDLEAKMEKLPVIDFSVFELHLNPKEHVFGALVLRLLRMRRIRTSTRKFKIVLQGWFQMPQTSKCLGNCPCVEPSDWRSQSISLTLLEEVEIQNFRGGDHEIDFITLIFGWAPMLKRMIIKLAYEIKQGDEIGGCATTIYNICSAHPSVNCFVYLYSGEKWLHD